MTIVHKLEDAREAIERAIRAREEGRRDECEQEVCAAKKLIDEIWDEVRE